MTYGIHGRKQSQTYSESVPEVDLKTHLSIRSKETGTFIPIIASTHREMYRHVVQDNWGQEEVFLFSISVASSYSSNGLEASLFAKRCCRS
jgi:hypothetical protein